MLFKKENHGNKSWLSITLNKLKKKMEKKAINLSIILHCERFYDQQTVCVYMRV